MTTATATHEVTTTMIHQIGRGNLLAVSGGRFARINQTSISLPVHYGYSVEVEYMVGSDTYTVRRMFRRGVTTWTKGTASRVHADELGEQVYRASCFRDEWGV